MGLDINIRRRDPDNQRLNPQAPLRPIDARLGDARDAESLGYTSISRDGADGTIDSAIDPLTNKRVPFINGQAPERAALNAQQANLATLKQQQQPGQATTGARLPGSGNLLRPAVGNQLTTASVALANAPSASAALNRPTDASVALKNAPSAGQVLNRSTDASVALNNAPSAAAALNRPTDASVALNNAPSVAARFSGPPPAPSQPGASTGTAPAVIAGTPGDAANAVRQAATFSGPDSMAIRPPAAAPAAPDPMFRGLNAAPSGPLPYGKTGQDFAPVQEQQPMVIAPGQSGSVNGRVLAPGSTVTPIDPKYGGGFGYSEQLPDDAPSYTGGAAGKFVGPDEAARVARIGSAGSLATPNSAPGNPGQGWADTQAKIVAAYPQVGVKGSDQNKAFIDAYTKSGNNQAGALDMAHGLFANPASDRPGFSTNLLAAVTPKNPYNPDFAPPALQPGTPDNSNYTPTPGPATSAPVRGPLAAVGDFFKGLGKGLTPASGDESGGVSADDPVGFNPVRAVANALSNTTQQPVADPTKVAGAGFNSGGSIAAPATGTNPGAPAAPKLPLFGGFGSSASPSADPGGDKAFLNGYMAGGGTPSGAPALPSTGATPNPVSTPNPPAVAGAPKPVDPLGAFAPKLAPTPVSLANNNPSLDPDDLLKKQKQPLFNGLN